MLLSTASMVRDPLTAIKYHGPDHLSAYVHEAVA